MGVRRATQEDARAIAEVHVTSWRGAYKGIIPDAFLAGLSVERRAQGWSRILREPNIDVFVALDDAGAVVGFSSLQESRDDDAPKQTGEITSIYVTPEAWGQGYGRALMSETLRRAQNRGFTCLTLWVLEANQRARRFYEAAGFKPDGAAKTETPQDGVELHEVRYRLEMEGGSAS